jgi:hypothetical protein
VGTLLVYNTPGGVIAAPCPYRVPFPDARGWINFPLQEFPPELELKKILPDEAATIVFGMGIYRLSEAEAKANGI